MTSYSSSGVGRVERVLLVPPDTPYSAHRIWRQLDGTIVLSEPPGPGGERWRTIRLPPSHEVYQLRGEEVIAPGFEVTAEQALAFIHSSQADHSLESLRRHLAARP